MEVSRALYRVPGGLQVVQGLMDVSGNDREFQVISEALL